MALTHYELITSTDSGALSRVVLKLAADGFLPLGAPFTSPKGEYAQVLVKGDVAGGGGGSAPAAVAAADITDATAIGISLMTAANQAAAAGAVLPAGTNGQVLKHDGTGWKAGADANTVYTLTAATTAALGGVKQGAAVADAVADGELTTLNALLASLRAAGVIVA